MGSTRQGAAPEQLEGLPEKVDRGHQRDDADRNHEVAASAAPCAFGGAVELLWMAR